MVKHSPDSQMQSMMFHHRNLDTSQPSVSRDQRRLCSGPAQARLSFSSGRLRRRIGTFYLYLTGVHPTSVHLMGGCLMGVYLTGVCLLGVYLTDLHLTCVHLM